MASLVSPGVTTMLIDESMFIPSVADTVPLFFVATQQNKKQPDNINSALGTTESNVVRTVTSLKQSTQLYGNPVFLRTGAGFHLHGDARNEYGLFVLNRYLGIGDLAYVVRANVNLNDEYASVSGDWTSRTNSAAAELQSLAEAYLNAYNTQNGYSPTDTAYRSTITRTEVLMMTRQVMTATFTDVTFAKTEFNFYDDNAAPVTNSRGYQTIDLNNSISDLSAATGLDNTARIYTAVVKINSVDRPISIFGNTAQTFNDLLIQLNAKLAGAATATVDAGNILIESSITGNNSKIYIVDTSLFNSIVSYISLLVPVDGTTGDVDLNVYANGFNQPATSTYPGFDGYINIWYANGLGTGVFTTEWTPHEAGQMLQDLAGDFKYTNEFVNGTALGATDAARRVTIVNALWAIINSNSEIRSELYEFNLIVCPGFPEVVTELLALCEDIDEEAFVIGDVPFDLDPDQAARWGSSPATSDSSRRISRNVAYYYPHGMASNLDGNSVFVPASAIAVRTYTYNDKEAEIWYAPAGARRGQVTGISRIGYLSGTLGLPTTFIDVALNRGQRNALYQYYTNLNPIVNMPQRGILVMGQKTSQSYASALDRVNVVRLCAYIRRQCRKLAFSYLFEPNDQITRDNLKAAIDGMLNTVVLKRGLVDYITVCDGSNNGPDVVNRHELMVDIALKPMLAIEFIIIPIRVVAQGADMATSI